MVTDNIIVFRPQFSEFVPLYRGVENIWVANGTDEKPGTEGYLYAKFVGGIVQELGSIFSYDEAKEIYEAGGGTLTYEKWLQLLLESPKNAVEAAEAKEATDDNLDILLERIDLLNNDVTANVSYMNSLDGKNVPTGTWEDSPNPVPGYYTWTKITLSWPGLSNFTYYFASGYKEPVATMEDIESQFPGHTEWDEYATSDQINALFPQNE